MKWFRIEPFMAAFRMCYVAAFTFFVLLLTLPVWAMLPALFWLAAMVVMVREYRRTAALDKAWATQAKGGSRV